MRWLGISLLLLLVACVNPYNPTDKVGDIAPTGEDTQTEQAAQWQPETLHVYIMDDTMELCEDAILSEYATDTEDDYNWTLNQAHLMCRSHNQEFPDEPRRAIGGGT